MKIINLPIEPLEERYSIQWDKWFKEQFEISDIDFITVRGRKTKGKIIHGSFLDVFDTNIYKTTQLYNLMNILLERDDEEPTVLFFHDLWNPGLANIAYIRDGMNMKNLFIVGCLHAGSYDRNDFLSKQKMNPWARLFEESMFEIVNQIYVATQYHKDLIFTNREVDRNKIFVTGFPMFPDFIHHYHVTRDPIVVFPHRLDSEKRPDLFDRMVEIESVHNWKWSWIKTKDVADTKGKYYDILGKAKVAVSFAEQETWGIAMQEATLLGCIPVVPRRLSYPELFDGLFTYTNFEEAKLLIRRFMQDPPLETLHWQQSEILRKGREAIPRMIDHIKMLTNEK